MSIPFFDKRFDCATHPHVLTMSKVWQFFFFMASLRDSCLHPHGLQEVHICMCTHGLTGSTHLTNSSLRLTNQLNQNLQTQITYNSPLPFRMPVLSKSVPMTHEKGASWLEVVFQVSQNFAIFTLCFIEYLTFQALGNNRNLFKFFNGAERENEIIPLLEIVNQIIWQGEWLGSYVVGMIMQ